MWVSSEKIDSDSKTESVFKVKEWMKLLWVWMQDLQFVEENYLFVMSLKPTDFFPTTEPFNFFNMFVSRMWNCTKTFIFIFLTGSNKKKIQEKKIYFHQMWNWVRKKKKSVFKGNKKHFFQKKKKILRKCFLYKNKKNQEKNNLTWKIE